MDATEKLALLDRIEAIAHTHRSIVAAIYGLPSPSFAPRRGSEGDGKGESVTSSSRPTQSERSAHNGPTDVFDQLGAGTAVAVPAHKRATRTARSSTKPQSCEFVVVSAVVSVLDVCSFVD